jgi:uncharacterized protein YggE
MTRPTLLVIPILFVVACKQPATVIHTAPDPQEAPHTVTVVGTASLEVEPDTAELRVTLSSKAARPGVATKAARAKQSKLLAALTGLGVEQGDVALSHLSVSPEWNWETQRITGYVASIVVTVTTKDFDRMGPLMEVAADAGATAMDSMFRSDLSLLKAKVRDMALTAVKDKAAQISGGLDVKLGTIVGIVEGSGAGDTWNSYGDGYYYSRNVPNVFATQSSGSNAEMQPLTLSISVTYDLS